MNYFLASLWVPTVCQFGSFHSPQPPRPCPRNHEFQPREIRWSLQWSWEQISVIKKNSTSDPSRNPSNSSNHQTIKSSSSSNSLNHQIISSSLQWLMIWDAPPPSSHQQDDYILVGSPLTFSSHCWEGSISSETDSPSYSPSNNPFRHDYLEW